MEVVRGGWQVGRYEPSHQPSTPSVLISQIARSHRLGADARHEVGKALEGELVQLLVRLPVTVGGREQKAPAGSEPRHTTRERAVALTMVLEDLAHHDPFERLRWFEVFQEPANRGDVSEGPRARALRAMELKRPWP